MALPTKRKTWTIDPSNQIPFVSLNATMAALLFESKVFLKANGYTVDGSCDGTTGAMDAVDRWTDATKTTTRGAAAGNAQSWMVLKDANNNRSLLAYQGASDDVCRISFAPGSAFSAAGTPNQQPTSGVEQVLATGSSVINATATGDRRWHGWVDSTTTPKAFRIAVSRANLTASIFGVEDTDKDDVAGSVTWDGAWGFFCTTVGLATIGALNAFTSGSSVKRARPTVSGVPVSASCFLGGEVYNGSLTTFANVLIDMQGASGYPMVPQMLGSSTTSAQGKYGVLYDWWSARNAGTDGDVYGSNAFVVVAALAGLVWPWDGSAPVFT